MNACLRNMFVAQIIASAHLERHVGSPGYEFRLRMRLHSLHVKTEPCISVSRLDLIYVFHVILQYSLFCIISAPSTDID
jgi:hypothetical protein